MALFAWLLTLHPSAAGRVYAAYGGVYVATAMPWLWWVDGVLPDRWDLAGAGLILLGALTIVLAQRQSRAVSEDLKVTAPTAGAPEQR